MIIITVFAILFIECSSFLKLSFYSNIKMNSISRKIVSFNINVEQKQIILYSKNTAGSDSLGFSTLLSNKKFVIPTQIIFGSNAIEHGVNLLEVKTKKILLVSGWNSARLDPVLWELEPRGFKLHTCSISNEPSSKDVHSIILAAIQCDCGAILAMGCGSVLDAAKLATKAMNSYDRSVLLNMTAEELESEILSGSLGVNNKKKNNNNDNRNNNSNNNDNNNGSDNDEHDTSDIFLVTIPCLPCGGAELSDIVALKKIHYFKKTEARTLPSSSSLPSNELQNNMELSKVYLKSVQPSLCLVQSSLTYRAPMHLLHDRLISLIAAAVDIILSDLGFMSELLAWDSLRRLMPLYDLAVVTATDRVTQWILDPDSFELLTVHDDEKDHRSQYFRRYGHGFSMANIEDLCHIGISVATARAGTDSCNNMGKNGEKGSTRGSSSRNGNASSSNVEGNIGGLQFLVDCMGELDGCKEGYIRRISKLFPLYMIELENWSDESSKRNERKKEIDTFNDHSKGPEIIDDINRKKSDVKIQDGVREKSRNDPFKAFIRTKLNRISEIFQNSKYLCHTDVSTSFSPSASNPNLRPMATTEMISSISSLSSSESDSKSKEIPVKNDDKSLIEINNYVKSISNRNKNSDSNDDSNSNENSDSSSNNHSDSNSISSSNSNSSNSDSAIKSVEMISESSGLPKISAAVTSQLQEPESSYLLHQLNNMINYSRLLCGPDMDVFKREERESEGTKGIIDGKGMEKDSLTKLIENTKIVKLKIMLEMGINNNNAKVDVDKHTRYGAKKGNESDYVISDYILYNEFADVEKINNRLLPNILVSDLQCYSIKNKMKEVCGLSPACMLSINALKSLLSVGYLDGNVNESAAEVNSDVNAGIEGNDNTHSIVSSTSDESNAIRNVDSIGPTKFIDDVSNIITDHGETDTVKNSKNNTRDGFIRSSLDSSITDHKYKSSGTGTDPTAAHRKKIKKLLSELSCVGIDNNDNNVSDKDENGNSEQERKLRSDTKKSSSDSQKINSGINKNFNKDKDDIDNNNEIYNDNDSDNSENNENESIQRKEFKGFKSIKKNENKNKNNANIMNEIKDSSNNIESKTDVLARLIEQKIHERWLVEANEMKE